MKKVEEDESAEWLQVRKRPPLTADGRRYRQQWGGDVARFWFPRVT